MAPTEETLESTPDPEQDVTIDRPANEENPAGPEVSAAAADDAANDDSPAAVETRETATGSSTKTTGDEAPANLPDPQNDGGALPISTPDPSIPTDPISAPAQVDDDEPLKVVALTPANTQGGSTAAAPSTAVEGGKAPHNPDKDTYAFAKEDAAVGDTVLYRVSPLDPPEIKNHVEVEEADRLPATILKVRDDGSAGQGRVVDLEIHLPDGSVVNQFCTEGDDSGQWHYGPEMFATTKDDGPDREQRPALDVDNRGEVREDAEAESAAGTNDVPVDTSPQANDGSRNEAEAEDVAAASA